MFLTKYQRRMMILLVDIRESLWRIEKSMGEIERGRVDGEE